MMASRGFITTSDGVGISYTQNGLADGANILFLPGWRQTAAQWKKQVDHFRAKYRVTTFDYRGHGESDKPASGYTVRVLAGDLNELLGTLDLRECTAVGHSMGASVVWAFWDAYPGSRHLIQKFVIADQAPCMLVDPSWSETQVKNYGAVFTWETLDQLPEIFDVMIPAAIRGMFTEHVSEVDLAWFFSQNEKCPKNIAIELLRNHASQDWRAVIPTLKMPVLVIGAEGGQFPLETGSWIQEQVSDCKLVVIKKDEGACHFMFWEASKKFNSVVQEFIEGTLS
ncbi:Alpha/Beta hydrolase protein [Pestalotiopsis sp. NC0098]|nr:Alpha/Beta hydrolase protein [Pestalotiopsis sp. NC0098]